MCHGLFLGGFTVPVEGLPIDVVLRKAFLYLVVMSAIRRIRSHMFKDVQAVKLAFNARTNN